MKLRFILTVVLIAFASTMLSAQTMNHSKLLAQWLLKKVLKKLNLAYLNQ